MCGGIRVRALAFIGHLRIRGQPAQRPEGPFSMWHQRRSYTTQVVSGENYRLKQSVWPSPDHARNVQTQTPRVSSASPQGQVSKVSAHTFGENVRPCDICGGLSHTPHLYKLLVLICHLQKVWESRSH